MQFSQKLLDYFYHTQHAVTQLSASSIAQRGGMVKSIVTGEQIEFYLVTEGNTSIIQYRVYAGVVIIATAEYIAKQLTQNYLLDRTFGVDHLPTVQQIEHALSLPATEQANIQLVVRAAQQLLRCVTD